MKPRSFFFSLFLGNFLLIAAILGLGISWTFCEVDRQANANSRRFQGHLLALAKSGLEEAWPDVTDRVQQYCRLFSSRPEFRLTVVDSEGRVLGDSDHAAEDMSPHNTEQHPEIVEALQGTATEATRFSQTARINYRYAASPIMDKNAVVGVVRIAVPVSDIAANRRRLLSALVTGGALMLLTALFFATILSWLWSKPLHSISRVARQIADGNLDPIPEIGGFSEMIDLRDAIDTMRQTVFRQLDTITWQRERLQSVLQHLPDAVFALDFEDRIVYYNESAENLFGLDSFSVARSIQHVLRQPEILDFYFAKSEKSTKNNSTTSARKQQMIECRRENGRKIFELEIVDIADRHNDENIACLLIASDLTGAVQTERMKADFVANTSHELRTPLTSIRMTLDNALDGIFPANSPQEAFEMLDRGVRRLENLTDDLLALHSVENNSGTNKQDKTTLAEQKSEAEEMFQRKMLEKKIDCRVELADDQESTCQAFFVDTKRLGLVIQNLLDNALKFTPGGGKVALRFAISDDNVLTIQCEDSGCGISPEDQNRVFERFYRVKQNKAHQQPGTGLGLSIVKHAVERLGGSLSLSSQLGVGSLFTVRVPISIDGDRAQKT